MDNNQIVNQAPLVALGLVALAAVYSIVQVFRQDTSKVPGPWYTKWTRAVLTWNWLKGRRTLYVHALHEQYGSVVRIAPGEVDFSDKSAFKQIYNVKSPFRKADWYTAIAGARQFEHVFTTTDNELHRRFRRLLAGPMSESSLKSMVPLINSRVDLAIEKMKDEMKTRGAADVLKWWMFMATDIIGELSFGTSFQALEAGKKTSYIKDLEDIAPLGALRTTFPFLTEYTDYFPLPVLKRAKESLLRMRKYARESVGRYQKLVEADPDNVHPTLFTNMFRAEVEEKLTFQEVVNNAQGYIVAGTDTTANTLTYLVWRVCRNPAIKARLLSELQTLPESGYDDAELRELPYLTRVIEEALRLHSAAPSGLPRAVPQSGANLAGYHFDAGTTVCTQAYTMHRNPEVFVDPETFNPDRWESATKDMKDAFMPFGAGSRICLGLHLARIELRLATARFFLAFPNAKISTREGMSDADMAPEIYFLVVPKGHRCLVEA
ncbi:cytochrome protein [Podospora didyma]|uniref:Cytochrome protein n=1 Tax=Podospora didyma TaxID=330526 RepID=A0AAE0TVC2_9PEZI|nr:cytochrome protein [Podospora didyma]